MTISRILLFVASLALFNCAAPSDARSPAGEIDTSGHKTGSWANRLNPSGKVPKQGFKAVYFDRKNLSRPPITETVDSIAIKYAWAHFHQIDSSNFAGYWVGQLNFREATLKQITVSQSRANSRILIDGDVVFEGGESKSFDHEFSRGSHIVEVEYINNWHTTEFKVTIGDAVGDSSPKEVLSYLRDNTSKNVGLNYVGIYESGSSDTHVNLSVPRSGKPLVLWLSSYEAVDWNISASDRVEAVVMSSYAPGSRLSGILPKQVFHMRGGPRQHTEAKRCTCSSGGIFHCEDRSDLVAIASELKQASGLALVGYAMKYAASDLSIVPFDEDVRQRVVAIRKRNDEAKRACSRHSNPDFDQLFD